MLTRDPVARPAQQTVASCQSSLRHPPIWARRARGPIGTPARHVRATDISAGATRLHITNPTMSVSAARLALRAVRPLCVPRVNLARPVRTMSSVPYRTIATNEAPSAIGPYSQAVVYNGTAYVSGCIPFDPATMQCVDGGIEAQAQRSLDNLLAVAKAAGSDKSHILKVTVFLKDMNDFAAVNVRVYVWALTDAGRVRKGAVLHLTD